MDISELAKRILSLQEDLRNHGLIEPDDVDEDEYYKDIDWDSWED